MDEIKLYLHVGIHKTGTTAIQHFLRINNKILKESGIYLPVGHFSDNRPQDLVFKMIKNDLKYMEILDQMKKECIRNKCHSIILSNEDMVIMENKNVVEKLNELFDLKVLIYLRREDKYLESNYSFFTTLFETRCNYKKSIYAIPAMSNISKFFCNLIKVYDGIIDKKRIYIKSYDEVIKNDFLLGSFLEMLGLDLNEKFKLSSNMKNVSPNKYIVEFMTSIDDRLDDREQYYKMLNWLKTKSIIKNGPQPIFFTKKERIDLMNRCCECNKIISNEYFDGKSIFDKNYDIEVPESIARETIETLIVDIKKQFNLVIKPIRNYTEEQKNALERDISLTRSI